MPKFRIVNVLVLMILASLGFTLTACGGLAGPEPDSFLSVVITDDGQLEIPTQEFFIEKTELKLYLDIMSHGGTESTEGKMFMTIVTIVSLERDTKDGNLSLGSVQMLRTETNTYGGNISLRLPKGSYAFMLDGRITEAIIKVSPRS